MRTIDRWNFKINRTLWHIVAIWITAIFLRLYKLGFQALFFDEAHSWLTSQYPLSDLLGILLHENHVPFYYLLLKIYLKFIPQTEIGLRSFSVIFSLLSLAMLMWVTYRCWGIRAAVFAGWLLAISPFEIYYAQETRMYTLLSFQWMLSLAFLLIALAGKPKFLIPWSINLVLISYVQATGLILAATHALIVGGIWITGKFRQRKRPPVTENREISVTEPFFRATEMLSQNSKWVLLSGAIIALGVLPTVLILLFTDNWHGMGGGVWIPTSKDFLNLFLLFSVGTTAVRSAFLDSANLTLPIIDSIPTWGWFIAGMAIGGLAIYGAIWAWKTDRQKRLLIGIVLFSLLFPIAMVWLLGKLLNQYTWAYKSFLGSILLLFMLAGIGFSRINQAWLRRSLVVFTFCVALLSLIPYFTIWQKSEARIAFQSAKPGTLLLERSYLSSLAHFYLGKDASLIGLVSHPENEKIFWDIQFGPGYLYGYKAISCHQVRVEAPKNIWIYGNGEIVRQHLEGHLNCFGDAQLWIFENGSWIPFDL